MKKTKILFFLWSFSLGGGAEKILSTIVNNLDSEKYDIDILEIEHFDKGYEPVNDNIRILKSWQDYRQSKIKRAILWRIRKFFPNLVRKIMVKEKYDIEEDDFLSAELELVPASKARDLGFDKSMILGYGQDDRICAFTSLFAMLESNNLKRTGCTLLVDKEEIGSVGASGMHSRFFENTTAEILNLMGYTKDISVRRCLAHSTMLSSDVSAGYDPLYANAFEIKNAAFLGKGLVFNKFTGARGKSGSNDANAEYMAKVRNLMDSHKIAFQTAELGKVDIGGGGTIAYITANYGMEVIDAGLAVLCMHSPCEVSSKADIYEAVKGYKAFLKDMY